MRWHNADWADQLLKSLAVFFSICYLKLFVRRRRFSSVAREQQPAREMTRFNSQQEGRGSGASPSEASIQRSVARSAVFQRNWATFEVLPRVEFLVRGLGRPILHANYMSNIVMFHWWNIDFWYWASFGLVLIGHWEGFVTKTWQPCPSERQLGARHTEVSAVLL